MKEKFDSLVEHLLDHGFFLEEAVELLEKELITRAMERSKGNRCAASKLLGIHRNTLKRKREQYQMETKKVQRKPPSKADGVRSRVRSKVR